MFGFSWRTIASVGIALVCGLVALALDLMNDGLVDQLLWEITGETEPFEQVLGGTQYLANFTRVTPKSGNTANIQNKPNNPFGINAFLELEAEPAKRELSMQLIAEAGFGWLRQQFAWEDIEIAAKGDFWDLRNVQEVGGHSSWDKYDQIVDLAEQYGVNILARLSGPTPQWALPLNAVNTHSPPRDYQDFVDYAVAVATRYQGRITHYQIWNEPNIYPEWGDQPVSAAEYADLLCRTHDALKTVDPHIVILTAALGPTVDMSPNNFYDLAYLQQLYDYGFGDCFDVLSAQGYGLFSGPTDRRLRPYTMNFQRHQWLRDMMVANGDENKPIWISEAGWNPVPNDPNIVGIQTYGQVTMEQAAEWGPLAYDRALSEWPWIGVIHYWFLKRPNENERTQSQYYFRLVEPTWEPTPLYYSLQSYIQSGDWRHPDTAWKTRAREHLPQVLIGGLAVLFLGYIFGSAVTIRFIGNIG